jgi:hypothetical protein
VVSQNTHNKHEASQNDLSLNIVVRNLPERLGENIVSSVNALIAEGIQIRGVKISHAERKPSVVHNGTYPGVVIVKCKSGDDKKKIMTAKRKLKDSTRYRDIYIVHDQTHAERTHRQNMKTIIDTIGRGDLTLIGDRVVSSRNDSSGDRRSKPHRRPSGSDGSRDAPRRHRGSETDNEHDRSRRQSERRRSPPREYRSLSNTTRDRNTLDTHRPINKR